MDLIIPTRGRYAPGQQATWLALFAAGLNPILLVRPDEEELYEANYPQATLHVLPVGVEGIAATRDYIIYGMRGDDRVVMLDDDLHFAARREDNMTLFRPCTNEDLRNMEESLKNLLEAYAHCGIGAREGGNRNTEPVMLNTRTLRVLGYRRDIIKKHGLNFMPMLLKQDFHMTLQLLRLGYDCPLANMWVSNQAKGSNAPGGCSVFRSPALMEQMALKLAELHPGFVRVVQKTTKTAWGGESRTDVTVAWKEARKSADRRRSALPGEAAKITHHE